MFQTHHGGQLSIHLVTHTHKHKHKRINTTHTHTHVRNLRGKALVISVMGRSTDMRLLFPFVSRSFLPLAQSKSKATDSDVIDVGREDRILDA